MLILDCWIEESSLFARLLGVTDNFASESNVLAAF
jgi:hypothetical protein